MKDCRPDYLAAILRHEINPKMFWTVGVGDQTTTWPKIVRGRFILKLCREFTPWKDEICLDSLTGSIGGICQHLSHFSEEERLVQEIKAALEKYERQSYSGDSTITRRFSCNACPTDVELEIGAEHAKFLVWCDLGTGTYPVDELWLSRTRVIAFGHIPPTFNYEHGSVRETYERN